MSSPIQRTLYVFLTKRPHDREPWPLVYESRELAEAAPHRCSDVVAVSVALSATGARSEPNTNTQHRT
jgi:hypothetical protein